MALCLVVNAQLLCMFIHCRHDTKEVLTEQALLLFTFKVAQERWVAKASAHAVNAVTPPMRSLIAVIKTLARSNQFSVLTQLPKRHLKMWRKSVLSSVRVYTLKIWPKCF